MFVTLPSIYVTFSYGYKNLGSYLVTRNKEETSLSRTHFVLEYTIAEVVVLVMSLFLAIYGGRNCFLAR